MQQRYHDPVVERFLSADPVRPYSSAGANFNRYRYADNNPYRYADPDGRCANLCTGAIGAGVGALVGFGVEGARQIRQGKFDGPALLVETGKGAVVGGLIGLTGGAAALPSSGLTLGGQVAATSSVALGVGAGAHSLGEVAKGNAAPPANESINVGYATAVGAAVGTAAGPVIRETTTIVTPAVSSHPVTSLSGRVFNTVNVPAQAIAHPKTAETASAAAAATVEDHLK